VDQITPDGCGFSERALSVNNLRIPCLSVEEVGLGDRLLGGGNCRLLFCSQVAFAVERACIKRGTQVAGFIHTLKKKRVSRPKCAFFF